MTRHLTLAFALAALTAAAQSQPVAAQEMRVLQGGEHFQVEWSGPQRDNLAGGGVARMQGGGDDRTMAYDAGTVLGQSALAAISGGGDDMTITHTAAEAPASLLAQRAPRQVRELAEAPATRRPR